MEKLNLEQEFKIKINDISIALDSQNREDQKKYKRGIDPTSCRIDRNIWSVNKIAHGNTRIRKLEIEESHPGTIDRKRKYS